jgi:hypothetical protein
MKTKMKLTQRRKDAKKKGREDTSSTIHGVSRSTPSLLLAFAPLREICILLFLIAAAAHADVSVIPRPVSLTQEAGVFSLNADTRIVADDVALGNSLTDAPIRRRDSNWPSHPRIARPTSFA